MGLFQALPDILLSVVQRGMPDMEDVDVDDHLLNYLLHTPSPNLFHLWFWLLQVRPRILFMFCLLFQALVSFCGSPILRRGLVLSSLWWAHGIHWLILS